MATYFYIVGNSIQAGVDSDVITNFGELTMPTDSQFYLIIGDEVVREMEIGAGATLAMPRYDANSRPFSLVNRRHIEAIKASAGYSDAQILAAFGWTDGRDDTRFGALVNVGSAKSLLNKAHYQNLLTNTGLSGEQIMNRLGLTDNRV